MPKTSNKSHSTKLRSFYNVDTKERLAKVLLLNLKYKCCSLTTPTISAYEEELLRQGVPESKIIGHVHFWDLIVDVTEKVFIPRLETFEFALLVKELLQQMQTSFKRPLRVLDLCCGTGVIGLFLKQQLPDLEVVLADISQTALKTALKTAKLHNLDVTLLNSDLFSTIPPQTFDLIVSNPLYLLLEEATPSLSFEPFEALFAKDNGLEFYKKILLTAHNFLNKGGIIAFEISPTVSHFFLNDSWDVRKDINSKERFAFKTF